jgi:hypothetical protein
VFQLYLGRRSDNTNAFRELVSQSSENTTAQMTQAKAMHDWVALKQSRVEVRGKDALHTMLASSATCSVLTRAAQS